MESSFRRDSFTPWDGTGELTLFIMLSARFLYFYFHVGFTIGFVSRPPAAADLIVRGVKQTSMYEDNLNCYTLNEMDTISKKV